MATVEVKMMKMSITVVREPCKSRSGNHRWVDHLPVSSPFAAANAELARDLELRVCKRCGARGRVNQSGQVVFEPRTSTFTNGGSTVRVAPIASRASWARKKTEHDR